MSGARPPRPGHNNARTGLRALAGLINDALQSMGTPPALAGPSLGHQSAVETTPVPHRPSPRPTGRAGRALRAAEDTTEEMTEAPGASDGSASPEPERPGTQPEVDENHVETWKLVTLAQGGDGEAFGQLYDRYADSVFRFIYFRVNDRGLAEDFTSETFLRALRRIGTITYQGRDIGAWFITIARNIVFDHTKSARHRLEITTADTIEGKEHAPSTEAAVLSSLANEGLMAAVAKLGDEQRECVMLRFIQGLSVSETAAVMGKNDGAIKALQHRAVRKLADLVGSDLR
jgi:RNA polymerase sigma-70 factor (ECF subfamily)